MFAVIYWGVSIQMIRPVRAFKLSTVVVLVAISAIGYAGSFDDGQIRIACNVSALDTLPDATIHSKKLSESGQTEDNEEGHQWVIFDTNDPDFSHKAYDIVFDCARTLPKADTYRIRLSGHLGETAHHAIHTIYNILEVLYTVSNRVPGQLTIELSQVAGPLDPAEDIAKDIRYSDIPKETLIPRDESCNSLACAMVLAGGKKRTVDGRFYVRAIGFGFAGKNAYKSDTLDIAKFVFEELGVRSQVVDVFKHGPLDKPRRLSHKVLRELDLITTD